MSAKQHKRLRKVAVGFAATMEQAGHRIDKVGYEVIEHGRQISPLSVSSAVRPEPVVIAPPKQQLVLRKDSLKAIIKTLKKRHA